MMNFNLKNMFSPDQLALITEDVLYGILGNVADSARMHWINLAKGDSSHLRNDYLHAIQPVGRRRRGVFTITLVGELAHVMEDGSPRLDLRNTLLGPEVPVVPVGERGKHENSRGGFYRAIPFRHNLKSLGDPYKVFTSRSVYNLGVDGAKRLANMVRSRVRELKPTKTVPYKKKTVWGERLSAAYSPKMRQHHKTGLYTGMVRMEKTYEKATQSQYITFRTISTSVTEGWIRRPIYARHYADNVSDFVNRLIPKALEAFVKEGTK